jgi:hypothetical protein
VVAQRIQAPNLVALLLLLLHQRLVAAAVVLTVPTLLSD